MWRVPLGASGTSTFTPCQQPRRGYIVLRRPSCLLSPSPSKCLVLETIAGRKSIISAKHTQTAHETGRSQSAISCTCRTTPPSGLFISYKGAAQCKNCNRNSVIHAVSHTGESTYSSQAGQNLSSLCRCIGPIDASPHFPASHGQHFRRRLTHFLSSEPSQSALKVPSAWLCLTDRVPPVAAPTAGAKSTPTKARRKTRSSRRTPPRDRDNLHLADTLPKPAPLPSGGTPRAESRSARRQPRDATPRASTDRAGPAGTNRIASRPTGRRAQWRRRTTIPTATMAAHPCHHHRSTPTGSHLLASGMCQRRAMVATNRAS